MVTGAASTSRAPRCAGVRMADQGGDVEVAFFCNAGARDCFSLSALLLSAITRVCKCVLQRILNFVIVPLRLMVTDLASFRRANCRNWRISVTCFGIASVKKLLLAQASAAGTSAVW